MRTGRLCWLTLVSALIVAGAACAPAAPPQSVGAAATPAARPTSGTASRIIAAFPADPPSAYNAMNPPGVGGQGNALQELALAGLTIYDNQSRILPQLAEAVPTVENGLWKVLPDGRMETTWKIREGAMWQDGQSFTSQDLAFTARVVTDPDLPLLSNVNYRALEGVDATDPRTVTVRWNEPFIKADAMFAQELAAPLPRHLLEQPYLASKATFMDLPYWGPDYIGTGPFRLVELERGSHMLFRAFDAYLLGRPKVDEVEVRFIPDEATIVANLLGGTVDLTVSRAIGPDHGFTLRDQWRNGRVEWDQVGSWFVMYPQFVDPNPPVILDLRFRRALLYATDREALADALIGDPTGIPHSIVHPTEPEYPAIESSIVRYGYNPRQAAQLIEATGYSRGSDGAYRDAAGRRLELELNATPNDAHLKIMATLGDSWGQQGIGVEQLVIPRQRSQDQQYRATFPGFAVQGHPIGIERFHSREARLPERNYTGLNNARYMNAELDGLIDRYFSTIPKAARTGYLAQIVRHLSDQVVVLPFAWRADPTAISSRLVNVGAKGRDATQAWNAHEWDVR